MPFETKSNIGLNCATCRAVSEMLGISPICSLAMLFGQPCALRSAASAEALAAGATAAEVAVAAVFAAVVALAAVFAAVVALAAGLATRVAGGATGTFLALLLLFEPHAASQALPASP